MLLNIIDQVKCKKYQTVYKSKSQVYLSWNTHTWNMRHKKFENNYM